MNREDIVQYYIDREYAGTSRKEDRDIKGSKDYTSYEEVKDNGKTRKTLRGTNPKIVTGAGAVAGAGIGMAMSNKNMAELKSLRNKEVKTPADLIRMKKLKRSMAIKIGGGTLAGGALAYGATKL